jgi:hypothetical protein
MRVNPRLNAEGYHDPTASDAIAAVSREEKIKARAVAKPYRPLIFVCSPLAGDVERNIKNARRYSKFAVDKGAIPIAPHILFTQFLDDGNPAERELGLFFGLVLLGKCDEVWAFGGFASEGMKTEIAKAKKRGLLIRYFNDRCEEVQPFA